MGQSFSIRLCEENLSFASSHFLIFNNGEREPLHGHNYRVALKGSGCKLINGMLFDFTVISPMLKELCQSWDHLVLLPANNPDLVINDNDSNYRLELISGEYFSIPKKDTAMLPLTNTSAEELARLIANKISQQLVERFGFRFEQLKVEVEESLGNSACFMTDADCLEGAGY